MYETLTFSYYLIIKRYTEVKLPLISIFVFLKTYDKIFHQSEVIKQT